MKVTTVSDVMNEMFGTDVLIKDKKGVRLGSLSPGDYFTIGDTVHTLLKNNSDGTSSVICNDFILTSKFGASSNWETSELRNTLNTKYYDGLAAVVGYENIIPIKRNLISLDGLDDYGECEDYISLLTVDEYKEFHKILGLMPSYSDWWWLITPISTPSNNYTRNVCCVLAGGALYWNFCDYSGGVRPFCVLNSSVLVFEYI